VGAVCYFFCLVWPYPAKPTIALDLHANNL
jgi:hypothetical protein